MTLKEKVLKYFEERHGKDADPVNGCEISYCELGRYYDRGSRATRPQMGWEIIYDGCCVHSVSEDAGLQGDGDFDIAARILKIGNPWRTVCGSVEEPNHDEWVLVEWCGKYYVYQYDEKNGRWLDHDGDEVHTPTKWKRIE
jgi:hypothetical protein